MSFPPQYTQNVQQHLLARSRRYKLGDIASTAAFPWVLDWLGRIGFQNSQFPSMKTILCVTDLINGMLIDGVWQKMYMVNHYPPDNYTCFTTPLLQGQGFAVWSSFGGILPGQLTINGLAGNGTNQYLDTGLNSSTGIVSALDVSLITYHYSITATGFGCGSYSTEGLLQAAQYTDGKYYSYAGTVANNAISGTSPGAGYYCSSRVSNVDHRYFYASSGSAHAQLGATDTNAYVANFPNITFYIHGVHNTGAGLQFPTADRLSFMAIGKGLTTADSANAFKRIQAYRASIGGGFV